MPIIVDGVKRCEAQPTQIQNEINSIYENQRFIKEILINGRAVNLDDVNMSKVEIHDDDVVEIQTCSLDELVEDSMQSAYELVPVLHRELTEVVNYLRIGDVANGSAKFSRAVDALQWNYQLLTRLSSLHPGPSAIHELRDECIRIIPLILEAWEMEDLVMLADVIEFEVLPWLVNWYGIIELFHAERKLERVKRTFQRLN
jgi:hypothetical protein